MLTRGLLVAHDVILAFALHALHNVVNIAKFYVVKTSPKSAFSNVSPVSVGKLLDSRSLLEEFLSYLLLPEVIFVTAFFSFNLVCITGVNFLDNLA